MKKNLIKIALLGVFAFLFSAGFVSCKDYDDEIDELNNKVNELEKGLKDLSGTTVKDVTYDSDGTLTVTMTDGTQKPFKIGQDLTSYELKSKIEGSKVIITLNAGGSQVGDAVEIPLGEGGFDATKLTIQNGAIYYDGTATSATIPMKDYIIIHTDTEGNSYGVTLSDGDGKSIDLWIADALPLTSIVLKPDAYLGGIQAMRLVSVDYPRWTQKVVPPNGEKGEIWNAPFNRTDTITISPKLIAYYHLNPSSATKAQIKKLSVLSDDKEYVTRAAASNPSVSSYSVTDGMLRVEFNITSEFIKAIDSNDELVTVLAIQADVDHQAAQTKITSDYGAVYRSKLIDFRLALVDKTEPGHNGGLNQRHLYGADATTYGPNITNPNYITDAPFNGDLSGFAQVAIDATKDYELPYKGKLDLKPLVTTHFRQKLDKKSSPASAEMSEATSSYNLADYGLVYRFEKSNYLQGGNQTPQNEFFDLEDGVITSKVYGTTGEAAIGREPLVRVDLYDTVNKQVVNSGWIKILITNPTLPVDPQYIDFETFVARCENLALTTTVEHMNVNVYNAVGLDKVTFHNLYELKTQSGIPGTAATLKTGDYGTVVERRDGQATETNLLTWTITPADMDRALAAGQDGKGTLTATVVYEGTGRDDLEITLRAEVYVPEATMGTKLDNYWNQAKTSMYVNTEIPGERTNYDDFWTNINSSFFSVPAEGRNRPVFDIPESARKEYPAGYEWNYNNTNNMGYFFQFKSISNLKETDANGVEYTITVDNDHVDRYATAPYTSFSYLLASNGGRTEIIAVIDTYTGYIEYNNGLGKLTGAARTPVVTPILREDLNPNYYIGNRTVQYPDNNFAKALLNRDHAEGSNMFSAVVETILYNTCRDIKVTNGEFNATFLRPVNATAGDSRTFKDSENNGKRINYVDLVKLTDWRLYTGTTGLWGPSNAPTSHFYTKSLVGESSANNMSYRSYWQYYNVSHIYVDIDKVTTDMAGGTLGVTTLPERTFDLSLIDHSIILSQSDLDAPSHSHNTVNYGYIEYENNGQPIRDEFKLRLPIIVEYQWGSFTTTVDVTVEK